MNLNNFIISKIDQTPAYLIELKEYLDEEVFFSIVANLPNGEYITSTEEDIKMQTVKISGEEMALFFAVKNDSRIAKTFAGMKLKNAIQMVASLPALSGLILQSEQDAWLAFRK